MAKIYARLIKRKDSKFTIDDVPKKWRGDVEKLLESEG